MKRLMVILCLILMLGMSAFCVAEEIEPYASQEIVSSAVMLSAQKKVVFNVTVTSSSYIVQTNYCQIYRDTGNGFVYIGSLSRSELPANCQGNLIASADLSSYITVSGTYKVKASYTVGATTRIRSATRAY